MDKTDKHMYKNRNLEIHHKNKTEYIYKQKE